MSDAPALLAAIRSAPDDDAPRLVYADWLDEHGQPERAEFIRVQCQLAQAEAPDLRRRESDLLAAHHDAFAGPLAAPHLRFRFRRGLIVGFGHTGLFVRDRLGPRSGAWSYYWFRCEGSWHSLVGLRSAEEVVMCIRERPDLFAFAPELEPYQFDALTCPASIRFGWDQGGHAADVNGTFDGKVLVLDIHRRHTDQVTGQLTEQHSLKRFVHAAVPGFDTFPET